MGGITKTKVGQINVGDRFSFLTVLSLFERKKSNLPKKYANVKCACSVEFSIQARDLLYQKISSCGACLYKNKRPNYKQTTNFNRLYNQYKFNAKKKNVLFNIDEEMFRLLTKSNCYYCKKPPSSIMKTNSLSPVYVYNGVDRLSPKAGYTMPNCVPCCSECNYFKSGMEYDEFINKIKQIYNHRAKYLMFQDGILIA